MSGYGWRVPLNHRNWNRELTAGISLANVSKLPTAIGLSIDPHESLSHLRKVYYFSIYLHADN